MKTIWITGGSSGIGYTTAEKFLNEGWRVIISSSKDENLIQAKLNLEKKTQSKEIYSFKCDISNRNEVNYVVKKISTENTHGTGCTLASSIAAKLAQGIPMKIAVKESIDFVVSLLSASPKVGSGNGPLVHGVKIN